MIAFAKRNLKVFFKDKSAVFFSLLAALIVIGLYALFLKDVMVESFTDIPNIEPLIDTWIVAGLLAITSVSTTMGAFGIMVDDKVKKIIKDFKVSPLSNNSIVGGYILSSFSIGIIMCVITLFIAQLYIVFNGGAFFDFVTYIKIILLIILTTMATTSMILFMVSFFSSSNAFATASTIIGTLIGFLTGIYMPVGNFAEPIQWVIKLFPISHSASLFRQVMTVETLATSFNGAPQDAIEDFSHMMGINFIFGETEFNPIYSILVLIGTSLVFYLLSVLNISRKKK